MPLSSGQQPAGGRCTAQRSVHGATGRTQTKLECDLAWTTPWQCPMVHGDTPRHAPQKHHLRLHCGAAVRLCCNNLAIAAGPHHASDIQTQVDFYIWFKWLLTSRRAVYGILSRFRKNCVLTPIRIPGQQKTKRDSQLRSCLRLYSCCNLERRAAATHGGCAAARWRAGCQAGRRLTCQAGQHSAAAQETLSAAAGGSARRPRQLFGVLTHTCDDKEGSLCGLNMASCCCPCLAA